VTDSLAIAIVVKFVFASPRARSSPSLGSRPSLELLEQGLARNAARPGP
jgi:hypothetical protein